MEQTEKIDKFTEIPAYKQKRADSASFSNQLIKFITQQYGQQAANQHKDAVEKIQQHRNGLLNLQDSSEGAKTLLLTYARVSISILITIF